MTPDAELEARIQKNALAIEELSIKIEALDRNVNALFNEMQVSPEQLAAFVGNKDNFTEEGWNALLKHRKDLDEKLMRELLNVRNPKNIKKAYAERNVQTHWLFVR